MPRAMAPGPSACGLHAEAAVLRLDVSDEGPGFDLERVGGRATSMRRVTWAWRASGSRRSCSADGSASSGMPVTGPSSASGGRRRPDARLEPVTTPGSA